MKPPERLRHWPEYKYLDAWLRVATAGLSAASRARVREEITDHFHQATDEGLRAGLTEDAAAEGAVEGLGSPKAARHAFRYTYLTRWQAYLVSRFVDIPQPPTSSPLLASLTPLTPLWDPNRERLLRPIVVTLFVALTAAQTAFENTWDPRAWQLHVGLLALMVVAAFVLVTAVPRLSRNGRERAALALGASTELFFCGVYLIAPAVTRTDTLGIRLWFLAVFTLVVAASYLPLLHKLSTRRRVR